MQAFNFGTTMSQFSAPTELLYNVIEWVWELSLTPDERVDFMTVSTLVSKGWSTIFEEISSRDLHIPCESFYHRVFADNTIHDFSKCKRLTFTVYEPISVYSIANSTVRTLSYMRYGHIAKLTSLNTIHIDYYNSTFPDPYVQGFFSAIPDGLPKLVISYSFSPGTPPIIIEYHRRHFERKSKVRYAEPRIGTLEINGADEYLAAMWESLFPTRERLVRDGKHETEPLLRVSSFFAEEQGLLVRLEDMQRQWTAKKRRENAKEDSQSVDVIPTEVDGLAFISSNSALTATPPSFPYPPSIGDVGYINRFGSFMPLFNTFVPHYSHAIPSLCDYGNPKIRSKRVNTRSRSTDKEGKMKWVLKKIMSIGKRMKYIDPNEGGAAANWFEQNAKRVVDAYGGWYGLAVKDIVLGITGS